MSGGSLGSPKALQFLLAGFLCKLFSPPPLKCPPRSLNYSDTWLLNKKRYKLEEPAGSSALIVKTDVSVLILRWVIHPKIGEFYQLSNI